MRSTPVVALAALLACLPARAVDVIDIGSHARLPAYLPILPIGFPAESFAPAPMVLAPGYFPAPFTSYFPGYFSYYFPADFSPYFPSYPLPFPAPHPPVHTPGDERGDVPSAAALTELALIAGAQAATATVAEPMPVPEPVSVLMLACGLLLMVPGAWASRWSRLGDTDSLLQRRFP
ncbi:hypothetical protein [Pseudoduganella lutea]|uniref:PEP-CTERM sorting domain-containing protein n=1 Tax=Pseudoduganella lutea TaxID=321985 RepID=A0A4P6KYB4_9BURK|nr:hypothetical protein [Pseudoduganella lutea]QBE64076.1 hypothetical protein EWM63_14725 [Pseudoduganella lutea]